MTPIPFFKVSGSGNDFIIIDNRKNILSDFDLSELAIKVCCRKLSVGADGLLAIEPSNKAHFKWRFYNSDGSVAEMCGNAARCTARVAVLLGIGKADIEDIRFETLAGIISARVGKDTVKIQMTDPGPVTLNNHLQIGQGGSIIYGSVNTGVPHVVVEIDDIEKVPLGSQGREIRYHDVFAPQGTNVNYIAPASDGTWFIRTYERGVEDETLACGTGNVAAALVLAQGRGTSSPIRFVTRSGFPLTIYFNKDGSRFDHVYLEGDARIIYTGELQPDAWQY